MQIIIINSDTVAYYIQCKIIKNIDVPEIQYNLQEWHKAR